MVKKQLRKLFKVQDKQHFGYHKYPLNFLRAQPDFLLIGSQKAATTTLHAYLAQNTHLQPANIKEAHFFNMHYDRGLHYYKSCFPIRKRGKLAFETTPDYIDHPLAPKLCHQILPEAKLILTLREPVERAFSHFNFVQGYNAEERQLSFEEGLEKESHRMNRALKTLETDRYQAARLLSNHGYLRKGVYAEHLQRWLQYYPRDRFLFIEFEDIKNDIHAVIEKICVFLEIPFERVEQQKKLNTTTYRAPMQEDTRERLTHYFGPHNEQLFALMGTHFNW